MEGSYEEWFMRQYSLVKYPIMKEDGLVAVGVVCCFEEKLKAKAFVSRLMSTGRFVEVEKLKKYRRFSIFMERFTF